LSHSAFFTLRRGPQHGGEELSGRCFSN
jgi:hypothetical protein